MLSREEYDVPTCPRCKYGVMFRVGREGFLERVIMTRLGRFPWMCSSCKARLRLRVRRPVVRPVGDGPKL